MTSTSSASRASTLVSAACLCLSSSIPTRTADAAFVPAGGGSIRSSSYPTSLLSSGGNDLPSPTRREASGYYDPLGLSDDLDDEYPPVRGDRRHLGGVERSSSSSGASASIAATAAIATWSASSTAANAAGPDWGIFEGRIGSLLHPTVMASMFLLSLSGG